ncbi:hypothetical protein KVR01_002171 [Diaporthe batatas]|uniref:uncharacterized protein n=1 Tax=Diaporthe batatas TaxID=748121 RepID=UPI001D045D33|nr:uncharacterized protein KVR01_002171 [Diaporthe batatas]KAG8166482.1 hypothetical protein KVR01_002171 [Diaporthe batatas]
MTQARSSSTVTDSGSMIGNIFKKAQFWRSSHNHTMSKEWAEQALPLRYLADDPMERDLDRILGKKGWEPFKVVQEQRIIRVSRKLTEKEIQEIVENGRNHYEQTGEALDAMR